MTSRLHPHSQKAEILAVARRLLRPEELAEIQALLDLVSGDILTICDLWQLMDSEWDRMRLDNMDPDWELIAEYYALPVWLLCGLFAETDPVSKSHRQAWRDWVKNDSGTRAAVGARIADYGGGFGGLAALLANDLPVVIDIVEPHPQPAAIDRFEDYENVRFVSALGNQYDYVFCSDVLEHVPDPVSTFVQLIAATRVGGKIMVANNFNPVIKCHLPKTFHLRYTFNSLARLFGLEDLGPLSCGHGHAFRRATGRTPGSAMILVANGISRLLYPIFQTRDRIRFRVGAMLPG